MENRNPANVKQKALEAIQVTSTKRIVSLLSAGTIRDIKLGFDFLGDIVQKIWEKIKDSPESFNGGDFTLFEEIYNDVLRALPNIPAYDAWIHLDLEHIVTTMRRIAMIMNPPSVGLHMEYLRAFLRSVGKYLSTRTVRYGIEENTAIWGNLFSDRNGLLGSICVMDAPKGMEELELKQSRCLLFDYYCGLLMNRIKDAIIEGFYGNFVHSIGLREDGHIREMWLRNKVFLALAAHSFLFYTAYCASESVECQEIADTAKSILLDRTVKQEYSRFLDHLSWRINMFNMELGESLERFMTPYERALNGNGLHGAICERTAREFFMCVAVYIALYRSVEARDDVLHRALIPRKYEMYASKEECPRIQELFARFLEAVDPAEGSYILYTPQKVDTEHDKHVSSVKEQAKAMYEFFIDWLKGQLKQERLQTAENTLRNYQESVDETKLKDKLRLQAENCIQRDFAPIMRPMEGNAWNKDIKLDEDILTIYSVPELVESANFAEGLIPATSVNLLHYIFDKLCSAKAVRIEDRDNPDLKSDRDYKNALERWGVNIFIGAPRLMMNREYNYTQEFQDFLKDKLVSKIYGAWLLLAMKENTIELRIFEIRVDIHSPDSEEIEEEIKEKIRAGEIKREDSGDSAVQHYSYPYSSSREAAVSYTKDELREYLQNRRKIIKIHFHGELRLNGNIPDSVRAFR